VRETIKQANHDDVRFALCAIMSLRGWSDCHAERCPTCSVRAYNQSLKQSTFNCRSLSRANQTVSAKGAITSKIKHAIKLKTPVAQLLQSSLAFCFSLQHMAAYRPGLDGTPPLAAS